MGGHTPLSYVASPTETSALLAVECAACPTGIPYKGTRVSGILAADSTNDGTRIHSRAAAGSGGIPI